MKHFAHFLRHPLIRIFLAPLGFGIYGLIVGMYHTTEINWLALGYLYLILVSSQLIDHYFFVRFNTRKANASSPVILYAMEILLWAATVGFMWQHHWGANLLLLLYIAYTHIQHYPYNLTNSLYQLILNIFFQAFIVNNLAYFSQTGTITTGFLISLLPLAALQLAFQAEGNSLVSQLTGHPSVMPHGLKTSLVLILSLVAVVAGTYLSFPSKSYFMLQLLFIAGSVLTLAPLLVQTRQHNQSQNKLNYLSTSYLLISILYACAYCF